MNNGYNQSNNKNINKLSNDTVDYYRGISVSNREYANIEPNITIRNSFSRGDYEYFRPEESVPTRKKDIIKYCMEAYRKIGIVHNIIDLMGDFCVKGIKIEHSNKQRQKFLRAWAKKVNFKDVSERFANLLFRCGNVVIKRSMAVIPSREEDKLTAHGDKLTPDGSYPKQLDVERRNIPIGYTFLNPIQLEVIGGELAQFTGKQIIGLRISETIKRALKTPNNEDKLFVEYVPGFIKDAVQKNNLDIIPLEQSKIYVSYYKKDDWQSWADPMIYPILDDLLLLEKMKLADLSALDGAISQVRLWKLGDKDKGVFASQAQYERLASILSANPGNGVYDVLWDDFISLEQFDSKVYEFLGMEKYEPVLTSIYAGLGVPQTLTGGSGGGGTTNNFISIQTMIERLEYVRNKIREFWEHELSLLQKSIGFKESAKISFDIMTLNDETAVRKLMIDLWDRHLLSDETLIESFKEFPEIELLRQRREERERKRNLRLQKAGPYFAGEKLHDYAKIALQAGTITPEDVGLERVNDTSTPFDLELEMRKQSKVVTTSKPKGTSGQGRPKNSKDSSKRKEKKFSVRTSASLHNDFITKTVWAKEAQKTIGEIVNPLVLKMYSKSSLRELTTQEFDNLEYIKFVVLSKLKPYQSILSDDVTKIIKDGCKLSHEYLNVYSGLLTSLVNKNGKHPNIEEKKALQAGTFALLGE